MSLDDKLARLLKLNHQDAVERDRLIIALDFGTTFSGIAYAFSTDPERVYSITAWPGADDRKVPKAPTVIKYEGSTTTFKWGYELDQTLEEKIEGIKLLLDPDQPRPLYTSTNTHAEIAKLSKPVLEVATDYIRAIYQHALREIENAYLADYIKDYDKQYVLSVPAVWSDKAKDMTQRAAKNAGISPIELIKEPEAAALYTLNFMKNKGLKVGDAIVICDAGGGTVDLISYEITCLDPLTLEELVPGSGGLAGSLMLNKRFEHWIQETVGDAEYIELKKTDGYRAAMQQFDLSIKPAFRSKQDPDRYISFPMAKLKDDDSKGIVKNSIILKGTTLFNIFDPIFHDINKYLTEQVNKVQIKRLIAHHPNGGAVRAIFLVGGFGSSVYLRDAIAASHPDIQVIQPNDAWSAIVKGAVLSKLPREAMVVSNAAEKHYGTCCHSLYDSLRDKGEERIWDDWEENEKCAIMQWFIYKKDEKLVRNKKIPLPFYRKFAGENPSKDDLKIKSELYESAALLAPGHPKNVRVSHILNTDLSKVPKSYFIKKARKSDGATYCELHFKLLIEIRSGPMKFSLEVGDEEYSAVNVDY
ncbi:hypothetical protein GP486_003228 [Trichoglossum hirsutum]|uniref:Uncharacterized protein n=1 Tax=Trichoglossum hirsutum TaxID=265104 RepID=A0A9P8RQZ1_9PEZI|nr:hypothetical protein GP486_003228 [Trichoglossum hirsutum]